MCKCGCATDGVVGCCLLRDVLFVGCWMLDAGCWMLDAGCVQVSLAPMTVAMAIYGADHEMR